MTYPSTLGTFGSPKKNALVLSNPKTSITQADWNPLANCVAQMTQTPTKLWAQFSTTTSNGAVTCNAFGAQWGTGSANAPTIARTGTGVYTVATPSTWTTPGTYTYSLDPDGIVITSEQVVFVDSSGEIDGSVAATAAGFVRTTRANYTLTVYVYNSSWTLSDLGGGIPIRVEAR